MSYPFLIGCNTVRVHKIDSLFIVNIAFDLIQFIMTQMWLIMIKFSIFSQGKFLAFYQYAKTFNSDKFDYDQLKKIDFVFMRWKVCIDCTLYALC